MCKPILIPRVAGDRQHRRRPPTGPHQGGAGRRRRSHLHHHLEHDLGRGFDYEDIESAIRGIERRPTNRGIYPIGKTEAYNDQRNA